MNAKFRLIKDDKIVGYEWHKPTKKGRIQLLHSKNGKTWKLLCCGGMMYCGWIDHDHKEQYTGLKDKNGVEIYIGDILSYNGGAYERVITDTYQYLANLNTFINDYPANCVVEVIGNIHTTPDLLTDNTATGAGEGSER